MALTFKTPMEEIVSCFEPTVQTVIAQTAAKFYQKREEENCQYFNYHLGPVAKKHLSEAGIYLSPYSAVPHSHPVCKTLENYLLYVVLPKYVNSSFFFVGMKSSKLSLLKSRDSRLDSISCINRLVTSVDAARYSNEFVVYNSQPHQALHRHTKTLESATLKDLVGPLLRLKAKRLFLHDELHYWSSKELGVFLEVMDPDLLLGTIVYPPELLFKQLRSLNRWCYTYEVKGEDFLFFPDGVRSEGYQQPLSGGYLLECNKIVLENGVIYNIDILCSKFAHHLVSITKGGKATSTYRSFGQFEASTSVGLADLRLGAVPCFPVNHMILNKIYRYMRTLKKPDLQSATAKLSQLVADPSGVEIDFVESFAKLVIDTPKVDTALDQDALKVLVGRALGKLPKIVARKLSSVKQLCLSDFIEGLDAFTYTFEAKVIKAGSKWTNCFAMYSECEEDYDVIKELDSQFTLGRGAISRDRCPAPYVGMAPLSDYHRHPVLTFNPTLVLRAISGHARASLICPSTRYLRLQDFHQFTLKLLGCGQLLGILRLGNLNLLHGNGFPGNFNDFVKAVRTRAFSIARPKFRFYFAEYGLKWFNAYDKAYQSFLCDKPEGISASSEFQRDWSKVVNELVTSRNVLPPTISLIIGGVEAPTTSQVNGVAESMDTVSNKEKGPAIDGAGARDVSCPCGIKLPLLTLLFPEHSFEAPDRLRGREAGWYSVDGVGYSYAGGTHRSIGWPRWLRSWMEVNGIDPGYNCCLYQRYSAGGSIGFHSDDESLFQEGAPVLTVNLGGSVDFGLKCCAGAYHTHLSGPCLFEMPRGFQLTHKHSVHHASEGRSSVTFRVLKNSHKPGYSLGDSTESDTSGGPDYLHEQEEAPVTGFGSLHYNAYGASWWVGPRVLPAKHLVTSVRGDGNCFWYALSMALGLDWQVLKQRCMKITMSQSSEAQELEECKAQGAFTTNAGIASAALCLGLKIRVWSVDDGTLHECSVDNATRLVDLRLSGAHFDLLHFKNNCVARAIAETVGRAEAEVMCVISERAVEPSFDDSANGEGLALWWIESLFVIFDIKGTVEFEGETRELNPNGRIPAFYRLQDDHLSFIARKKDACDVLLKEAPLEKGYSEATLNELRKAGTTVRYRVSMRRAQILADSLHQASTGVVSSELYSKKCNLSMELGEEADLDLTVITGTFGSGKSAIFRNLLQCSLGRAFDYVTPRRALADDFLRVAGLDAKAGRGKRAGKENWKVSTFETFLQRCKYLIKGQIVIVDEMQLYPPGYFDLMLGLMREGVHVFLVGDAVQSDYDNDKDRSVLCSLENNLDLLLGGWNYRYNVRSRRFRNRNFIGRLPCVIDEEDCVTDEPYHQRMYLENLPTLEAKYLEAVLVSSFDEKLMVNSVLPNARVLTFGESTGLNFNYGTIVITSVSERTNEKRWVTALSRFRFNLCLLNCSGLDYGTMAKVYQGRFLSKFLTGTAKVDDLKSLLPGNPEFCQDFVAKIGKDEGLREEKLEGDPWLKTMVDLMQEEEMQVAELPEVVAAEEWFRTHLPREELESVRAQWVDRIMAKEAREVRMGDLVSEQFTDDHSKQAGGMQLTNAAERYETIYPRHRANDTVTFIMAVKKRLRFSCPAKERAKLFYAQNYGRFLLKEFLKKVPLKPEHDDKLMAEAKWEFETKKLSKSAATIENHSGRSCRDWLADVGMIFSKSQLCTKFDNRFRVAKAAQSIVCFQHAVLCRFAPYMRYIEKKLQQVLPKRFYIHSGKGLDELNEWVKLNGFEGVCTESDYEAFDASQDEFIVAFEVQLMRFLRLPEDLIEDYRYIKTNLGSKLGSFAIMRFSGEASTFLFNTMANMLFTFLRYDLKGNESICFAGDDMCASTRLAKVDRHQSFLKKIKLKAKVQFTNKPTFCGWHLCPDGIYKKPQLVHERMCIAKELNNLANCIDNYAIEVAFAYKLGERAVNRMDPEEVGAFYNCVRTIIRNKHLIKSDVRKVFEDSEVPAAIEFKMVSLGYCL